MFLLNPSKNLITTPAQKVAVGLVVLSALAISGCVSRVETRGNELRSDQVTDIQEGPYTRERVFTTLGSPSSVSTFDDKIWYYIFERTETTAFFERDLRERLIVTIRFDDAERVVEVKTTGMENAKNVIPNENRTPTAGNKLNFIEQMIANLGRFTAKEE